MSMPTSPPDDKKQEISTQEPVITYALFEEWFFSNDENNSQISPACYLEGKGYTLPQLSRLYERYNKARELNATGKLIKAFLQIALGHDFLSLSPHTQGPVFELSNVLGGKEVSDRHTAMAEYMQGYIIKHCYIPALSQLLHEDFASSDENPSKLLPDSIQNDKSRTLDMNYIKRVGGELDLWRFYCFCGGGNEDSSQTIFGDDIKKPMEAYCLLLLFWNQTRDPVELEKMLRCMLSEKFLPHDRCVSRLFSNLKRGEIVKSGSDHGDVIDYWLSFRNKGQSLHIWLHGIDSFDGLRIIDWKDELVKCRRESYLSLLKLELNSDSDLNFMLKHIFANTAFLSPGNPPFGEYTYQEGPCFMLLDKLITRCQTLDTEGSRVVLAKALYLKGYIYENILMENNKYLLGLLKDRLNKEKNQADADTSSNENLTKLLAEMPLAELRGCLSQRRTDAQYKKLIGSIAAASSFDIGEAVTDVCFCEARKCYSEALQINPKLQAAEIGMAHVCRNSRKCRQEQQAEVERERSNSQSYSLESETAVTSTDASSQDASREDSRSSSDHDGEQELYSFRSFLLLSEKKACSDQPSSHSPSSQRLR